MWSRRSVTRAGDYLVSTPVARGPSRARSSPASAGPGTLLRRRTRYSSTARAGRIALRAGELPRLDLAWRAPPRYAAARLRDRASGPGARYRAAWAASEACSAPPGAAARPPACALHQRLELLGRHGLEDLTVELGDERVGAIGQRQGALQPSGGPRALEMRRRAAEVGVPEDQDDDVEDERHHRRGGHHLHARRQAHRDGEEDVDRVLGVAEGIAEAHRRHDAAEAERERDAVLDQQHDARRPRSAG